jgi:hypothetical protein
MLLHEDSTGARLVTKVWYPKRRWSSDRLWPYQDRFRRALRLLRERGFLVPVERAHGQVEGTGIRFVIYEWLDGTPLRSLGDEVRIRTLATFAADVHRRGVYFRGLHLGNIIVRPDGQLALLDVSDIRFLDRPLPLRMRVRNLGILCSHPEDLEFMLDGNWSDLVMAYCRAAEMSLADAAHVRDRVRIQMERRQAKRERVRRRRRSGWARTVYRDPRPAGDPLSDADVRSH